MQKSPILDRFGQRLRQARGLAGLDQAELAKRVGRARSSIANMEAGRQNPGLVELTALAVALDVSISVLCGETDHPRLAEFAERVAEWEHLEAEARRAAEAAAEAKRKIQRGAQIMSAEPCD